MWPAACQIVQVVKPRTPVLTCEFIRPWVTLALRGVYGGFVGYAPPPKWMTGSKGHVLDPVVQKPPFFDLFADVGSNSLNRPAVPST